ncbi:hypothetical protein LTR09_010125 [Extremus antarcticus]|uniref:Ketoreductase domain-containing protein n=1 Tax=Extremus antarcticus TaxID=702011 RepID=A0AAJ0D7Z7_9PEZI|nr:hypothetical protein LTR09_010125 [Extremus antarcticus]
MSFMESIPRPVKTYHTKPYDRISKHHGFDDKGRTVVVTGGASGLGLNFSTAFAAAGAARVALIGRSAGPPAEAKSSLSSKYPGTEFITYEASITDAPLMSSILTSLGTVDVLILNAAIAHRRAEATELTAVEMHEAFEMNTIATFNLIKAFLALPIPPSGRKTVLNVSSAAANLLGSVLVGYGASKAAGVRVMQSFAAQFPSRKAEGDTERVRIISFHPGSFYTPGVAANFPSGMKLPWEDEDLPAIVYVNGFVYKCIERDVLLSIRSLHEDLVAAKAKRYK